uniref:Importin subunit alpha n=1 Tax=Panagrolaimus superbus TaxID=310955 RepID=A0A914ZB45_9BILA
MNLQQENILWKLTLFFIIFQLLKITVAQTNASNNSVAMSNEEILDRISEFVNSADFDEQLRGITLTRQWLSLPNKTNFEKDFIKRGFLPILVNGLEAANTKLQYECAVVLGFFTEGDHVDAVVKADSIVPLVDLVGSSDNKVAEVSAIVLGQIITQSTEYRDQCVDAGIAKAFAKRMNDAKSSINLLRHITYASANICYDKSSPPTKEIANILLPGLVRLVHHEDSEILKETLTAISYIGRGNLIQMVKESGVAKSVILLLNHKNPEIKLAAIDVLGNISGGTDEDTQYILDIGVLPSVEKFLNHPNKKLNKEGVWFLINFLAGTKEQIQQIFDAGYIPLAIKHLRSGDFATQQKAAKCMLNVAVYGSEKHLSIIIDKNVIPALSSYMKAVEDNKEDKVIELGLQAIEKIILYAPKRIEGILEQLFKYEGIDVLKRLTKHKSEPVKNLSQYILDSLAVTENTVNFYNHEIHDEI